MAPGRAAIVERIEKAIASGQSVDPATGEPLKYPEPEDEPVELLSGMAFWIQFDRDLAGARNEAGFNHPDAVESALDRAGIHRAENRDVAKRMLNQISGGRNEAMSQKIEPERQT